MNKIKIVINYFSQFPDVLLFAMFFELTKLYVVFLNIILFLIIFCKDSINSNLFSFKLNLFYGELLNKYVKKFLNLVYRQKNSEVYIVFYDRFESHSKK